MKIREKGYYSWQGQLRSGGLAWKPIWYRGIREAFKKKFAKALYAFALMPFIVFLGAIYVSTKPELKMLTELVELLRNDAAFFNVFYNNGFLIFIILIMCVFLGAELISGDLKWNAFPLYFSRPLDRLDYMLGKGSILFFYIMLFTLVPGVLLLFFKWIFSGRLTVSPALLAAIVLDPVIVALFFTALSLSASSLSTNIKFARVAIFLMYFLPNILAGILHEIFREDWLLIFSPQVMIETAGQFLFRVPSEYAFSGGYSLALMLAVSALMAGLVYGKIGKLEAQIEAGD